MKLLLHCAARYGLPALLAGLALACSPRLDTSPFVRGHYDRAGRPHGHWTMYYDSAATHLQLLARYRHGRSVGRWQHYALAGYVERREHFRRDYIAISDYHPNGQLWYQGHARLVREPSGLHYFWCGDWTIWGAAGKLEKIETYDHGQRVASWSNER